MENFVQQPFVGHFVTIPVTIPTVFPWAEIMNPYDVEAIDILMSIKDAVMIEPRYVIMKQLSRNK